MPLRLSTGSELMANVLLGVTGSVAAIKALMWQHQFTGRHLRSLAADAGAGHLPGHMDQDDVIPLLNERSSTLRVVAPVSKALACGDIGAGAMAAVDDIAAVVHGML